MARIFITGSADGLGHLAAQHLVHQGHRVVLHARNTRRGQDALHKVPDAETVLTADLSNLEEIRRLAGEVNDLGQFDAVIHNAGIYQASSHQLFTVNTLAPYVLTCLINQPGRLIYLSSGMHLHGDPSLTKIQAQRTSYSDTKLHLVILAKAVARQWTGTYSNAVDPGWVPTKMGGRGAPDSLEQGYLTQAWLAVSDENQAHVSGCYFYHQKQERYARVADDIPVQDGLVNFCAQVTGVSFPSG